MRRWFAHIVIAACAFIGVNWPAAGQAADPTPATPPAQASVSANYVIGPGDILQVFVWRNPELSVTVPVRPDGKISTPLAQDVVAVGKTTSQLANEMEAILQQYIRSPKVNILVSTAVGTLSRVVVTGAVVHPGSVPFHEGLTVLDALLTVGGMSEFAAGNRAKIVRQAEGRTNEIRVRVKDLMQDGDLSQNKVLKPGDVIVIPESFF